jgi:hypothetical protein
MVLEGFQGSTPVAEILEGCGVLEGAKMVMRSDARLLKAEGTLVEAGFVSGGLVHVCVGNGGGMQSWQAAADPDMQGIFAFAGTGPGSPEQGLVEGLEQLLSHLTEDITEMEGAFLNLNLLYRSGVQRFVYLMSSCMRLCFYSQTLGS